MRKSQSAARTGIPRLILLQHELGRRLERDAQDREQSQAARAGASAASSTEKAGEELVARGTGVAEEVDGASSEAEVEREPRSPVDPVYQPTSASNEGLRSPRAARWQSAPSMAHAQGLGSQSPPAGAAAPQQPHRIEKRGRDGEHHERDRPQ